MAVGERICDETTRQTEEQYIATDPFDDTNRPVSLCLLFLVLYFDYKTTYTLPGINTNAGLWLDHLLVLTMQHS